jgi:hypothetical protein
MYSWFCSFLLKPFVGRVNRRIAETLLYRDVADHRAIPIAVVGLILRKATQLRHAASWPSTRARIIKSEPRPAHQRRNGVTQVVSVPDIQHEVSLGDRVIRGTRVTIGEMAGAGTEETLDRYPVGGTVPVYSLVAIALVFFGLALFFSGAFR